MIFALYHSPTETVGLMEPILKKLKFPFKEVHLYDGEGLPRDTSDLEGLIVMGGPMNVDEIRAYPFLLPEVQLIEKALQEKKPVLGICLGAQLIAKALGSKVYPNKEKELGWHPIHTTEQAADDSLFKAFPSKTNVLHWHGDTFDLPKEAVHLAYSDRCKNQAFKWGSNVYALQYHLEVTPPMLKQWCASKDGICDIKAAGESSEKIQKETPAAHHALQPLAEKFFHSYLNAAFRKPISVS